MSKVYSRKNGTRLYVHSQMAHWNPDLFRQPTSYKSWTDCSMTKALEAVHDE